MKNILLGMLLMTIFLLAGCSSQTVVKYQCNDGSFVDSIDFCSPITKDAGTEISNSSKKPAEKIERFKSDYQYIYTDKYNLTSEVITKYDEIELDCESSKAEKILVERENPTDFDLLLFDEDSYDYSVINNMGDGKYTVEWYPSLSEGKIYAYWLKITNIGCTKLNQEHFSYDMYLIKNDAMISSLENYKGIIMGGMMEDWYPEYGISIKLFYEGSFSSSVKIFETGEYFTVINLYYDSLQIAQIRDIILIQ